MGYPWSDGFSLIANDLNPAINHTTVKLHSLSGIWETTRQNTAGYALNGSTAFNPMGNMSFVISTGQVPATASWAANFAFSLACPSSTGNAWAAIYWNGAIWSATAGSFTSTSTSWALYNEDICLVGVGTVQLYGKNTTAAASCYGDRFDIRRRPVFCTPY